MPRASFVEEENQSPPIQNLSSLAMIPVNAIYQDPVTDVRSSIDTPEANAEFAAQIAREGLAQPILVRPRFTDSIVPSYLIIAGRRRWRAVSYNNLEAEIPAYVIDADDATARRLAFEENHRRKQFSPIDYARLFLEARGDKFLPNWSERVSKQFGVSRATVTETIKMYEGLAGDQDLIDQVHAGTLAADAAILLAKTKSEEREAQLEVARALAAAEEARKPKKTSRKGSQEAAGGKKQDSEPSAAPAKVKAKHVRAAAQAAGQPVMGILKRDELIAGLQHLIVPEAPPEMNAFLDYATAVWAAGKGTMSRLQEVWRAIMGIGTPWPEEAKHTHTASIVGPAGSVQIKLKRRPAPKPADKKKIPPPAKKSAKATKPAKPAKSRKK